MIQLKRIVSDQFFEQHPEILGIWPPSHAKIVQEAVTENLQQAEFTDIGGIYALMLEGKAIGITGYYPFADDFKESGLRWHGILNEYRGVGYSKEGMRLMLGDALARHPNMETLIELLPVTQEGQHNRQYFESLGFRARGKQEIFSWADHAWQEMAANISDLMQNLNQKSVPKP